MSNVLADKYRPSDWDQIFGQDAAVTAMRNSVERRAAHAYLLSGPSGVGKTTMARIAARKSGCSLATIREIDAATHTGIDNMRQVQDSIQYRPFGEAAARALIVDECHNLSKQAWDSLLKVTEEPPEDVFWFLCTTNPDKVPKTIKTRCVPVKLHELPREVLTEFVEVVCDEESINLDSGVRQLIVGHAGGSPRQALANLEACRDCRNRGEAAKALDEIEAGDIVRQLCQLLAKGDIDWVKQIGPLWGTLREQNPEGVRIAICNYIEAAATGAKTDREVTFFLNILGAFNTPYGQADGKAMLMLAIGRCVFPE